MSKQRVRHLRKKDVHISQCHIVIIAPAEM